MKKSSILLALILAVNAAGLRAQLYKWVDEKGVMHYTETPPPGKAVLPMRSVPHPPNAAQPAGKPPEAKQSEAKQPAPEIPRDIKALYDRNLLAGSWGTNLADKTQISIVFTPLGTSSGTELIVGQRWVRDGKMSFKANMHYRIAMGSGGRGVLEGDDPNEKEVPPRLFYSLQGNTLVLDVSGGKYEGQYRLTKQK